MHLGPLAAQESALLQSVQCRVDRSLGKIERFIAAFPQFVDDRALELLTLELGLRDWVREQTGLDLGYAEQLYAFGDRNRDPRERAGGLDRSAPTPRWSAARAAMLSVAAGTAARIFTGAPIPDGADAVIMQEQVEANDQQISFDARPVAGINIRPAGNDIQRGTTILSQGCRLRAHTMTGLIAVGGCDPSESALGSTLMAWRKAWRPRENP